MKNLEKKRYWVWFSLISDLENKTKQKLIEWYSEAEVIYQLKEEELREKGLSEKIIHNLLDKEIRKSLDNHLTFMKENDINLITIQDKDYPYELKQIYDPPISLYCKGDSHILNQESIAIVGCREATAYGEKMAKYFAYHLSKHDINIVSGLAKGIDSFSHKGSIYAYDGKVGGKTIAVLGNGLDRIYPKENEFLAKQIIQKGGAILSEYPLGTKPNKMNFPARNRIISGISKGVIVIEAKERSGALITVDFALEQGRDVFVVPGNIDSICSVGTNRLIQEGAKMITKYDEIFWKKY